MKGKPALRTKQWTYCKEKGRWGRERLKLKEKRAKDMEAS